MSDRKNLSPKTRFEVFKRDKFTCQYCGRTAPDVVLEVDHITPVAKGGTNDMMNLVTSCWECNNGKGARELSDDSAVKKQQAEMNRRAERMEQIKMIADWRKELIDIRTQEKEDREKEIDELHHYFCETLHYKEFELDACDRDGFRRLISKHGFETCLKSIDLLEKNNERPHSLRNAIYLIGRYTFNAEHPKCRQVNYLRKIILNRFPCAEQQKSRLYFFIEKALTDEDTFYDLKKFFSKTDNYGEIEMFLDPGAFDLEEEGDSDEERE